MESFFEDLRQSVQCSLCNQQLQDPKLLQCFHTFCKSCIQRHSQPKEHLNYFNCPVCSSETILKDDVEDLHPSLLHSRMLQVLALTETEKSCAVSESHSPALWHCCDCDNSLCDKCLKYHSKFTQNHKVISLPDVKKEDIESSMRKQSACITHSDRTLEVFCEECEVWACLLCLKDDHNGHKTLTLQEVTATKKDLLQKNLDKIKELELNKEEMELQQEIATNMVKDAEEAKKKVQKITKMLVKCLLNREQQLVNEIQRSKAKAQRNLNIILHIPAAKEYMKSIVDKGLASAVDMVDCAKQFTYEPFNVVTSGIVFRSDNKGNERVKNAKLGHVRLSQKSSSIFSSIEVDEELTALAKSKLSVVTKTLTGALNYDDCDEVEIQISPEDDARVEQNVLKNGSKIQAEFVPRVPGQLTAEVRLNGIPVSNSPLVMNVKPQNIVEINKASDLKTALNTGSQGFNGIAVNKTNSRIAVVDRGSHCVRVFKMDGEQVLLYGGEGSAPGQLNYPKGLAFLTDTELVIADCNNHRICIVNTNTGSLRRSFGRHGNGIAELSNPRGVHVDNEYNIIVSDYGNSRVQVFTRNGDYQYQLTVPNQKNFTPHSTVTHNGLFYVSDLENEVVQVIGIEDGAPTLLSTIGHLKRPSGLAIDNDHNLLVCDFSKNMVTKFTLDGRFVGKTRKCTFSPEYIALLDNNQFVCSTFESDGLKLFQTQKI